MNLSPYKISEKFVLKKLNFIQNGKLILENYDGKIHQFGIKETTLNAKIKIHNPKFYFNIIRGGSTALAESYIRNEFETSNLPSLIELTAKNIKITHKFSGILNISSINSIFKKIFISNTKKKSVKDISKHYDLGNEFFSTWLDKTLTYSCGIFEKPGQELEKAQINKYNKLINLIKPKPGDRILEIGCGWGGFAEHLAKNYDVQLDCITISKKQFEFTKKRINILGLQNKVKVKFLDYRDLKDKYDAIASIEMIEAVGEKNLNKYFKTIKNNLKPNGVGAIQAIIIKDELFDRYKKNQDFIQKYIFPGGFLPSLESIKSYSNRTGLVLNSYDSYGNHYSKTLSEWRKNFTNSWSQISKQGFDNSFKKIWDFYFSYCEAGFNSKNIDLIQFSVRNK
mgnify:CR=1 FL=1